MNVIVNQALSVTGASPLRDRYQGSSMVIPANRATRNASAGVTARLPVATFWIEFYS